MTWLFRQVLVSLADHHSSFTIYLQVQKRPFAITMAIRIADERAPRTKEMVGLRWRILLPILCSFDSTCA